MKMFMETLEERARLWYEGLPPAILYSLEDFYSYFCKNDKEIHPPIEMVENFYGNFESLFQYLGIDMDDEDLMNDEIKEALLEFNYHQEKVVEASFHNNQESLQQTIVFLLNENEANRDLNVESHVLPLLNNERDYEDFQSSCSLDVSFSESLFQKENIQEVVFLDSL